jgi:phage terminase large subunit-like protein
MLMIGTRWHEDDVLGSVCFDGAGAEEWERLVLPFYAEEGGDDPLGRASGEMLWPARFAASDVPSVAKGEISSRSFAALYQQRPQPAGGDLVKLDWLSARYKRLPAELTTIAALDAATKTGVGNDYRVIIVLGVAQQAYYVLDVVRRRVEYPDLRRMVEQVFELHHPRAALRRGRRERDAARADVAPRDAVADHVRRAARLEDRALRGGERATRVAPRALARGCALARRVRARAPRVSRRPERRSGRRLNACAFAGERGELDGDAGLALQRAPVPDNPPLILRPNHERQRRNPTSDSSPRSTVRVRGAPL